MDNQTQKARQFSTRFLPSDGIPQYNALLDSHLGKRREFLLGNRHSLELMQQTGVIERVETQPDKPHQYVVHIADKPIHRRKRLPPQLPESQARPWRQHSTDAFEALDRGSSAAKKANAATLKALSRSYSVDTVTASRQPVMKSAAANRLALFGSTKCSALLASSSGALSLNQRAASEPSARVLETRQRSRSAAPALTPVDTFKSKGRRPVGAAPEAAQPPAVKGTVEHLLESDAAFMTQIRAMKDQLAELESTRAYLDTEIGLLRRKLRGVNAVRENDVAVAHCSSIMQHRLSKAEEEFMKLVTQQQQVKKDVDRVRRELLSLRKVRHKLQEDIEHVAQANQTAEEKIYAAKSVRNQLSEELSELERRADVELDEQRLNLPPEDAVVVDVAKLMGAVQQRTLARRDATVGLADTSGSLAALQASVGNASAKSLTKASRSHREHSRPKTLLDYCTAFRVLQHALGVEDLAALEDKFTVTEEQLLFRYKGNLALADEVAALEKELAAVKSDKKANRASAREIMQANDSMERDLHGRVQTVRRSIRAYNELREQRNREHAKLRGIMLRCLDALQVDARPEHEGGGAGASSTHSLYWTETQSPELLEMLQRKMTQVAIALKVKHSSKMLELPPEALRLNRGHDGRRSNMFSTREQSKIVLGPRQPSGAALAAILGSVQPPSVENALALTEHASMSEVLHGLHRAVSPARRTASSLALLPPETGKLPGSSPVVQTVLGGSQPHTLSPVQGLTSSPSLAAMAETEDDEDEEETEPEEPEEDENDQVEDEETI